MAGPTKGAEAGTVIPPAAAAHKSAKHALSHQHGTTMQLTSTPRSEAARGLPLLHQQPAAAAGAVAKPGSAARAKAGALAAAAAEAVSAQASAGVTAAAAKARSADAAAATAAAAGGAAAGAEAATAAEAEAGAAGAAGRVLLHGTAMAACALPALSAIGMDVWCHLSGGTPTGRWTVMTEVMTGATTVMTEAMTVMTGAMTALTDGRRPAAAAGGSMLHNYSHASRLRAHPLPLVSLSLKPAIKAASV